MELELARAARERYSVCFVMIDIDYFKKINDTFGHDAGDSVLRKLATQLLSQARVIDIICRYGGEEFLAILPNVTAEIAFQITQRWRQFFMGSTLPLEYNRAKATISCGISEYPAHGIMGSELITLADKAMYQAKAKGRNRVVIWQAEHEK
jgi:diguanylate cyclase (GGDEF)-like protein